MDSAEQKITQLEKQKQLYWMRSTYQRFHVSGAINDFIEWALKKRMATKEIAEHLRANKSPDGPFVIIESDDRRLEFYIDEYYAIKRMHGPGFFSRLNDFLSY